jgi:hypothetical protein
MSGVGKKGCFFFKKKDQSDEACTCLADFSTETVECVGAGITREEFHLLMEDPGELIVHGVSQSGMRDPAIVLHESHLDVLQVEKGYPSCTKLSSPKKNLS